MAERGPPELVRDKLTQFPLPGERSWDGVQSQQDLRSSRSPFYPPWNSTQYDTSTISKTRSLLPGTSVLADLDPQGGARKRPEATNLNTPSVNNKDVIHSYSASPGSAIMRCCALVHGEARVGRRDMRPHCKYSLICAPLKGDFKAFSFGRTTPR